MERVLRFGVVGTGGMGRVHLQELARRDDAQIVALCDASASALERARGLLGERGDHVRTFTELAQMLADTELDAVVIATPHTEHAGQIMAALRRGLHVLVEKPMATTAKDARAVLAEAEACNKVVAIAYQRHGDPGYQRAREIVAAGSIGDIRLITVLIAQDCLQAFLPGRSWRADPALSGGGHFMDTGSHINDMMLWVSGLQPASVCAHIDRFGTLVDVCTALSIRFDNGAVGTFAATSLSPEWREEFSFYGTEGVLNIRDGQMYLQVKGQEPVTVTGEGSEVRPVEDFITTIRGGKAEPQAPALCGLRVAQISEAAYKSAETGRSEPVG